AAGYAFGRCAQLAGGAADRVLLARVWRADRRARADSRLWLGDQAEPALGQSHLRAPFGPGDLPRGSEIPARLDHPQAGADFRELRPHPGLAALARPDVR